MKALVIAPQPFFSPRGTPFSVYYRTLIASELGVSMDFLTYGQGQDVDIPGVRFFRTPAFRMLGTIKIGPSALKLFHDIFIFSSMFWLLLRHRYDVVHAHEEAVFFAVLLKPLFGYKLLYDMHSSLPQQLENFNFSSNRLLLSLFEWLEKKSLMRSDAIITICPDLYDYVNKVLPGNNRNFLIENSILEPVRLKRRDRSACNASTAETAEPVSIPERFRQLAVYAGTLESYQGIDILIRAIPSVLKKYPDTGFLIIGGTGEQVDRYRKLAQECGVAGNTLFTGRVPQALAREYTARASVLLSPRSSGTNTPLKIYEQLASGIPLVATAIYSHTQVLTDEVAFLVQPDPEDMARGIVEALDPEGEGGKKAEQAKILYNREYSRPVYVQKLKNVLESLS